MHANFGDLTPDGFDFWMTLSRRTSEPVRHAPVPPGAKFFRRHWSQKIQTFTQFCTTCICWARPTEQAKRTTEQLLWSWQSKHRMVTAKFVQKGKPIYFGHLVRVQSLTTDTLHSRNVELMAKDLVEDQDDTGLSGLTTLRNGQRYQQQNVID